MEPRRWRVVAVLCAGMFLALLIPQAGTAAPARSGTILGWYFPFAPALAPGPGPDCDTNADCLPWHLTHCPDAMAGIDPAVHTSIVDVADLAGADRRWTFTIEPIGVDLIWGGVSVQLWSASCQELAKFGGDPPNLDMGIKGRARFRIKTGARWMTVASVDSSSFRWELK